MNQRPPTSQWVECPHGTLDAFRNSGDQHRRQFLKIAGGGALCLLVGSVGVGYFFRDREDAGKQFYNCRETRELLERFAKEQLNEHQLTLIRTHLKLCPPCEHFYQRHGASA